MADEKNVKRRKRTKSSGGRTTPKKRESGRYTPPTETPTLKQSRLSRLVPYFMFGFFGIGVIIIVLNYLPGAPLLPGDTQDKYLVIGLVAVCLGFVAATRYK